MKTILIKRPRNGELFEEIERQIVTDCKDEKDGFTYTDDEGKPGSCWNDELVYWKRIDVPIVTPEQLKAVKHNMALREGIQRSITQAENDICRIDKEIFLITGDVDETSFLMVNDTELLG
jgi:hypothetical protein